MFFTLFLHAEHNEKHSSHAYNLHYTSSSLSLESSDALGCCLSVSLSESVTSWPFLVSNPGYLKQRLAVNDGQFISEKQFTKGKQYSVSARDI